MKLNVFKTDGKESGTEVELSDEIFAAVPNEALIYEDVRRYQAGMRQGTAKTKERGEVRGGGRKAYKQKGTGMARRGSTRSPLLKGGGTVFGPRPRTYKVRSTKKMKQQARCSALALKAAEQAIIVVEDFDYEEPKTRNIADLIEALELKGRKVLMLTAETRAAVYKSARNIPGVDVLESNKPATYQILNADVLLIQESAIEALENSVKPKSEEAA